MTPKKKVEIQNTDIIPQQTIAGRIIHIRGKKVMIDRDLAELYGVETKNLNRQVKRNIKRFPAPHFMFQLTEAEKKEVVTNWHHLSALKYSPQLPYAFTEQGVAMLSSVLNSERAIEVNIQIILTFTRIRELVSSNKEIRELLKKHGEVLKKHDTEIKYVFEAIQQLLEPSKSKPKDIGFKPNRKG